MQFNLKDNTLYYLNSSRYQNSLVSDRHPQYFEWVQNRPDLPTFYTYSELGNVDTESDKNVVLLESTVIIPDHIRWIWANHKQFNKIYTHNSDLLGVCPNARWIPGGGVWIGTEFGGGEIKMYDKDRFCSFFSSTKAMCSLHRMRLDLFKYLDKNVVLNKAIDTFHQMETLVQPIEYLERYMFSVIFENYQDDLYFTEKILNCFATGTIPIYLGARKIGDLFDANGIIQFNNIKDFLDKIKNLTLDDYYDRIDHVRSNMDRCKKYVCVEDYMWTNYMKDEYERRNPTE